MGEIKIQEIVCCIANYTSTYIGGNIMNNNDE